MNNNELKNCDSRHDDCPCPVWGCPNRSNCKECTRSHKRKGHFNACAYFTILPILNQLLEEIKDPEARRLIDEKLIKPNEKAYSLCRRMRDDLPMMEVLEFLKSPVDGLRCNAHASLLVRTNLHISFNPLGSPDEISSGYERWKNALSDFLKE